jgi:hypothetical protein
VQEFRSAPLETVNFGSDSAHRAPRQLRFREVRETVAESLMRVAANGCANGFWQSSWLPQNALSHCDALSAPFETFGRADGRGQEIPAPNIRAKFGEGLRPRRYARPKVYAPTVQAVPLPTLPTSRVCDARIRWRTRGQPRQSPTAKKEATRIPNFDRVPSRLESDVSGQQELGAWTLVVCGMRAGSGTS